MTNQEVIEWIADIFEEPVENIELESSPEDIEAWDSLGVLTLIAGLDDDFDILLTDEEIQELRTVKDILAIFDRSGKLE